MTDLGKKSRTEQGIGTITHETDHVWTIVLDSGKVIKLVKDLDTLLGAYCKDKKHGNSPGTDR